MTAGRVLADVTVSLYLIGTGVFLAYLLHDRQRLARVARLVMVIGFTAHTASLAVRWLETRVAPPTDVFASMSFFAWAIVGASLLFQGRYRVPLLGAFATPLAALLMLASSSAPAPSSAPPAAVLGLWVPAHVALVVLGDALLALSACSGLMYLLQEHTLKAKRVSRVTRRLPSLEVLDAMNSRLLTIGFPLLTLGLLSGAILARFAWGTFWSWEPKVVLSVLTWILYAVLLHARRAAGWRGRRAALGAIAGFVVVLATVVGLGLFRAGHGLA